MDCSATVGLVDVVEELSNQLAALPAQKAFLVIFPLYLHAVSYNRCGKMGNFYFLVRNYVELVFVHFCIALN